jgi:hypothetical protein
MRSDAAPVLAAHTARRLTTVIVRRGPAVVPRVVGVLYQMPSGEL